MKKLNQRQSVLALSMFFGWYATAPQPKPSRNALKAHVRPRFEAGKHLRTAPASQIGERPEVPVCVRFGGPWGSWRGVIVLSHVERHNNRVTFHGRLTTGGTVARTVPPQCPVHIHELVKAL